MKSEKPKKGEKRKKKEKKRKENCIQTQPNQM